jgi:predicted RNase H-like HicB family nuclease
MTRKYSLLIEGGASGYSAHVPELPTILVTGKSIDELTRRATEAIQLGGKARELERLRPHCTRRLRWSYPPQQTAKTPCVNTPVLKQQPQTELNAGAAYPPYP